MSANIKVSIITINYNDKVGLEKTIKSIINQDYKNIEFILIDGNSSDGSKDVILNYQSHIDYWISEPDKGIYNALNKGLANANGDYIHFLNSGDWLVNNRIVSQVVNNLSGEEINYGNLINYHHKDRQVINKGQNGKSLTLNSFFEGLSLPFPASFFKKSIFDTYGVFDEKYKIVSDWKFYINTIICNSVSVKYIDLEITNFDMNGISSTNIDLLREEHKLVLRELFPDTILNDYYQFNKNHQLLKYNRFKILKELEYSKNAQKVVSAFLHVSLKLFRNRSLSDL